MKAVALKDVCRITNGGTPKSGVENLWHGGVAWLTPAEMGKRLTPYIAQTARTISQDGLANSSAKLVPPCSVILSTRAPIGHLAINETPMAFNQGCRGLTPSEKLDTKYLYYFLYFSREALDDLGTGTTFKELSSNSLANFQIPLPSFDEQQRIVAVLDNAFAGIATAAANARINLSNVRDLFRAQLSSAFNHAEKGWSETTLGDVCIFENGDRGSNYPNRSEYVETGIPWINTGHIQPNGSLSVSDMNYITRDKFNSLRSGKIRADDLVYCLRGATIGKTAMVAPLTEGAVASSLVIIRPKEILLPRFGYYFLISPFGQDQIRKFENGAAQPNLGAKSVAQFKINLPPRSEQLAIVDQLDIVRNRTQCLEAVYNDKLQSLGQLKQSLLQKAFAGELT